MANCNGELAKDMTLAERFVFCGACRDCKLGQELPHWFYNFNPDESVMKFADGSGFNLDYLDYLEIAGYDTQSYYY